MPGRCDGFAKNGREFLAKTARDHMKVVFIGRYDYCSYQLFY